MCAIITVAAQRTHRTTFRALKVTFQVAAPGAESAVYDRLCWRCRDADGAAGLHAQPRPTYRLRRQQGRTRAGLYLLSTS